MHTYSLSVPVACQHAEAGMRTSALTFAHGVNETLSPGRVWKTDDDIFEQWCRLWYGAPHDPKAKPFLDRRKELLTALVLLERWTATSISLYHQHLSFFLSGVVVDSTGHNVYHSLGQRFAALLQVAEPCQSNIQSKPITGTNIRCGLPANEASRQHWYARVSAER